MDKLEEYTKDHVIRYIGVGTHQNYGVDFTNVRLRFKHEYKTSYVYTVLSENMQPVGKLYIEKHFWPLGSKDEDGYIISLIDRKSSYNITFEPIPEEYMVSLRNIKEQ